MNVPGEDSLKFLGEHNDAVFLAFAAPNGNKPPNAVEVDQAQLGYLTNP